MIKQAFILAAAFASTHAPGFVPLKAADRGDTERNRSLIIVIDGLRPDYITQEWMPHLHALGENGVFGDVHSAAFPTVTRVNSPSVSTGSYPSTHGLMHNTMFLSGMPGGSFSTGNANNLMRMDEFTDGRLLTSPSIGEILEEAGLTLLVTGSGGSGNTFLQNHRGTGMGIRSAGGFFHPEEIREAAIDAIGRLADDNPGRTVWAFDSYLHAALSETPPDVTILWINETDSAGHRHGVGAPETLAALANVDDQIGRLLRVHEENNLTDRVNLFVTSDHGFTTNTGSFSVSRSVGNAGFSEDDVRVVNNMVFIEGDEPGLLDRVVETLQRNEEVGNIYTRPARPGSSEGIAAGTISMAAVNWDHDRSADILVSPAWTGEKNEFGFAGTTTRGGNNAASHGSDSPFDVQIRLVAAGPDLKNGLLSNVPTGNVDLTPTVLHLAGIEPPTIMDGRILHELLAGGPAPEDVLVHEHTHAAAVTYSDGFRYQAEIDTLQVGATSYLRGARTSRSGH